MPVRVLFLIAFAVGFSATCLSCRANLGDTLDEAIARYGHPISQGKGDMSDGDMPWYVFKSGKFLVQQMYSGKTCVMEDWCKEDRTPITRSEQSTILKANLADGKWGDPKNEEGTRTWLRSDGATALYDPIRGTMTAGNDLLLTRPAK